MSKYKINFTDSDKAKACLTELMIWYMKSNHPDVIDKMKQLITEHVQSKDQ